MAEKGPQSVIAGNYLAKPYALVDLPVYRTLPFRERAVLEAIQRSFNGFNNGRLCVSMDEIAERIGNANHHANKAAIGELVRRGLLAIEQVHPRGSRKSNEYRLTFAGTGDRRKSCVGDRGISRLAARAGRAKAAPTFPRRKKVTGDYRNGRGLVRCDHRNGKETVRCDHRNA